MTCVPRTGFTQNVFIFFADDTSFSQQRHLASDGTADSSTADDQNVTFFRHFDLSIL